MKILVTGSAGFMASHLVDFLLEKGHQVWGIDDLSGGYLENVNPKSFFYKLDLRNNIKTVSLIKKIKPQLIYHLAADATEGRSQFTPLSSTERNYLACINVLIGAAKANIQRIIMTSSFSVYGDQKPPFNENMQTQPVDIYAVSKTAMEQATKIMAKVHGFEYTILRPHNCYGPRQNMADPYRNVIAIFINCLLQNKRFYIYGDGKAKRSFSYIDDVTPYIAKAGLSNKTKNEIINIGPRDQYTINHLAKIVLSHFFKDPNNIPEQLKPKYVKTRPQEVKFATCSDKKVRKLLNFKKSTTLEEGVAKMVAWAKKVGPKKFVYLKNLEIENRQTPITWKNKLI